MAPWSRLIFIDKFHRRGYHSHVGNERMFNQED